MNDPFEKILGQSAAAEAMREFGRRAAAVDAPVLLLGESGTGKGVLARAIHDASPRARGPFVAVNCAAIPETLFESEFFGHVRGAFTGAQYAHKGLFEQAHGGTLFLDEIGELPMTAQAKLLTVLEDRVVRRVGAERTSEFNARIIAATAVDLATAAVERRFRADLLHRLSVLCFRLEPLRERLEDVALLAYRFLQNASDRYHRPGCVFDAASVEAMLTHTWPGNIRELGNVVEAAVVSAVDGLVRLEQHIRTGLYEAPAASPGDDEHTRIREALRRANGNKTLAARELGIARTTLWAKLKRSPGRFVDVERN